MLIYYLTKILVLNLLFQINTIDLFETNFNNRQQIIQLNNLNLSEEILYPNEFLINLGKYLPNNSNLRLQILPSTTSDQSQLNLNTTLSSDSIVANKFYIDNKYNLFANGSFDRECLMQTNQCQQQTEISTDCVLKLKIASYDEQNDLISIFNLPINLEDINDCKPEFKSPVYNVDLSENLSSRTVLPLEAPTDLDSSKYSVQKCFIDSDNFSNLFDIHFNIEHKNLYLIVNSALDRENRSEYNLKIACSDNKNQARADIVVKVLDANDNIPFFRQNLYNITVNENQQLENLVQIDAFDLDDISGPNGQLVYSLPLELNSFEICNELFMINESSGLIGLRKSLDHEKSKKYSLKVKVQDKGANPVPIYTDVTVNVKDTNDNPPVAHLSYVEKYILKENRSNNTIWITEEIFNQQAISLAYLTLTDSDSPGVNGFNLSAELVSVSYLNSTSLGIDYEKEFTFRLVPIIQEYNNIYYGLHLIKQVDREEKMYFDLQVKLRDNSGSKHYQEEGIQESNFNLRIILFDINDNHPEFVDSTSIEQPSGEEFKYYKFFVSENQLKLNFANVKSIDLDSGANSQLDYKILEENNFDLLQRYLKLDKSERKNLNDTLNPNYLFYINSDNGSISLRGELDREQREYYIFTVRGSDNGTNSLHTDILVEISIIDENDNQPLYQLSNVRFSVDENLPVNSIVGNVKPFDPDFDPKTNYLIQPAQMNKYFHVDQETGNLLTSVVLDAEDSSLKEVLINNSFTFKIMVNDTLLLANNEDSMSSLNVTVHLNDLNDNPPQLIYPQNQADQLIAFDLNNYQNECAASFQLKSIKTIDNDRDVGNRLNHAFKFASVRRLSWQFVYEIIKNQLAQLNFNSTLNANKNFDSNDSHRLLAYLENILSVQQKNNLQPISKVNLSSVFSISNSNLAKNEANLNMIQICRLNWGYYNLSIQINDNNHLNQTNLRTDLTISVFAFNSLYFPNNTFNISQNQLELLNTLINSWWSHNLNLVAGLKRRAEQASAHLVQNPADMLMNKIGDDNGDEIDSISQEYYRFYASSSLSRFNINSKNNSILHMANTLLFNKASNSIVLIISAFVAISIILVVIITYKHSRASYEKNKKFTKQLNKHKNTLINVNQLNLRKEDDSTSNSASLVNISELSNERKSQDNQSTKDLSSSPRLSASKFNKKMVNCSRV